MSALKRFSANALYRENIFGSEMILNNRRFIMPNAKGRRSMKNLYLYAMVKKDAINYLKTHKVKEIKWQPSVTYNNDAKPKGRKFIGVDIDSAYWAIARKMKILSLNTYNRGYLIKEKHILVSSLSTLGRDKRYKVIRNGIFTDDVVVIAGRNDLKNLYKQIRYTCYTYMKRLAALLGNDFIAYKTDCIYFFRTKKNIQIVKKFLESKDLDYKPVTDFDSFHDYAED
jgi:hypothetical protein